MNIDINDSNNSSQNDVRSKYFTTMDESLNDFQETKKKFKGPKTNVKGNGNTEKRKRPIKKVKGQKDIRKVLGAKKNDLAQFTKEFDNVCKKSGVDVDPEQLQLAIALSRSLQDTQSTSENTTHSTKKLNTKERSGIIRRTLQEYGFKVPETKITTKKVKKDRKQYKLIYVTDVEKSQIISEKYSQVLFENLDTSKTCIDSFCTSKLYCLTTSAPYDTLKDTESYYINNLVEKSSSTGCLLRNWAEIPGRPLSPVLLKPLAMNFSEIECSQEELEVVLSGTFKNVYKIMNNKSLHLNLAQNVQEDPSIQFNGKTLSDTIPDKGIEVEIVENLIKDNHNETVIAQRDRSCSPDLFDDDSTIIDNTKSILLSQENIKTIEHSNNDVMDLTECVNIRNITNTCKLGSYLSETRNMTKRKSNDFMEITECVANSSQCSGEKIDLTQIPDDEVDTTMFKNKNEAIETTETIVVQSRIEDNPDLTRRTPDNTIVIKDVNEVGNNIVEIFDLTQSSGSCRDDDNIDDDDDLPFVDLGFNRKLQEGTKTVTNNIDDVKTTIASDEKIEILDLTQEPSINEAQNQLVTPLCNVSMFEDYIHYHSDTSIENKDNNVINNNTSPVKETKTEISNNNDIDLTQSSESDTNMPTEENHFQKSADNHQSEYLSNKSINLMTYNNSSLGKMNDISIDYDEIINEDVDLHSQTIPNIENNKIENNSSHHSEIFEISDEELDYSIHQSRLETNENFMIGGISIMDNMSDFPSFNEPNVFERSSLPKIDQHIEKDSTEMSSDVADDENSSDCNNVLRTPKNCPYIVKTIDVTPMQDYASMSTPERNKELDKYGIKPFKRKRAVQLLTHIYNQLHPTIELSQDDQQPSPAKKFKANSIISPKKKIKSPRKNINFTEKAKELSSEIEVENYLNSKEICYQVTKEIPDIKDIECSSEDWVFQKREKAKVHSCRVPLHVAFHNYVSCRRGLREAILRYEPINIDVVHKDLVGYGHRYDPKELLKFMDKKCITVKTVDNEARNKL